MAARVPVCVEVGPRRTFAAAVEWPGWARSGRSEEEALEALRAYAPRYATVAAAAVQPFVMPVEMSVTEVLTGGSGTTFGVLSTAPAADSRPVVPAELDRQSRLLRAAWMAFDEAWRAATEARVELRKGPRGGGRDLERIQLHVLGAEEAYLSALGSRVPRVKGASLDAQLEIVRSVALATLAARVRGEPINDPSSVKRRWLPRYYVRRSAWHALDHAWEIEDRST